MSLVLITVFSTFLLLSPRRVETVAEAHLTLTSKLEFNYVFRCSFMDNNDGRIVVCIVKLRGSVV